MGVRGVHHLPAASFSCVILTHPRGVSRGKCCDCKKSAKSVLDLENTRVCGRLQGLARPIDVAFASWPSPVRPGLVDGSASRGDDAIRGAFAAARSGADGEGNRQHLGAVLFRCIVSLCIAEANKNTLILSIAFPKADLRAGPLTAAVSRRKPAGCENRVVASCTQSRVITGRKSKGSCAIL